MEVFAAQKVGQERIGNGQPVAHHAGDVEGKEHQGAVLGAVEPVKVLRCRRCRCRCRWRCRCRARSSRPPRRGDGGQLLY